MKSIAWSRASAISATFVLLFGVWNPFGIAAKDEPGQHAADMPRFQVDPLWPQPLPDRWVTNEVGGVCVDAQDHVFTVNHGNLTAKERKIASVPPPVIEFDADGKVANSWGDRDVLPARLHGCLVDYQGNVWIAGSQDAIVQKYTHDGSKMLLQIGTKGKFDSSNGARDGTALSSSHVLLDGPAGVAVDPANGDIYIADGYRNRRVVVFDSNGHFLRQWGRQATQAETDARVGGVFQAVVHCVVIGNDGLVYVCDRWGDRIEVFDKMGNFRRNILIESKAAPSMLIGSAGWIAFSPDPAQKFMYVADWGEEEIRILDHASGQTLSTLGRPGHEVGEFEDLHTLAVDSKGNIIEGETTGGRRIQRFRLRGN
jgi:hypothetical protein